MLKYFSKLVIFLLIKRVLCTDAKFWVGRGDKPSPEGIRIPDENGKETPLRKYDKKTIVLTLPGVRKEAFVFKNISYVKYYLRISINNICL